MRFTLLSGLSRSPIRRALAASATVALGSAMVVGLATSASAAAGCSVNYVIASQWPGGSSTNITITNLGDPISGWALTWTFPVAGQAVGSGWSGNWSQSGLNVTVTNLDWNANLATNGQAALGYNGTWTTSNPVPAQFKLNGVVCTGGVTTSPSASASASPSRSTSPSPSVSPSRSTSPSPSVSPSRSTSPSPSVSPSRSASPSASVSTSPPPPGTHVDNPFAGSTGYVNPEWKAHANAEPGGSRISNTSTAVWVDRIAAITGVNGAMGVRAHLDAAVTQDAANGTAPLTVEFVIYDLPNRDCSALASNGELLIANNGLARYKTEYIDPIAAIMADSKYSNLRIVTVIEPDSLPNLLTNLSFAKCSEAQSTGAYVQGVQYALNKLHAMANVYTYIDAGHHAWLGWDTNFGPIVDLFYSTVSGASAGVDSVDGFITNTANTSATVEPYFTINTSVNGTSVRQSKWVDWNQYVDEQSYAIGLRTALVAKGFRSGLGMLIDTSRNGWGNCVQTPCAAGGPALRPTAPSTSTDVNTFVNNSRIDRRIHAGNWCNQSGAGMGYRPTASPAAGLDAYVWIKPPGESDGGSTDIPNDEGKGFDRMCDPTYTGNSLNGNNMTGALPNAPLAGQWFSAQFQQLMANAYPPLS